MKKNGYSFFLPLAFGTGLDLSYTGVAEGIGQMVSDMELDISATGTISLLCDVENSTPLNLALDIQLLDKNGKPYMPADFQKDKDGRVTNYDVVYYSDKYQLERKTDFVKLAEAFGAVGMTATTPAEFEKAFCEALKIDGPVLIDAYVDKDEFVLPMLPPGGSIEDIITAAKAKGEKSNG